MIKTRTNESPEVDMTPMIDIVFQLIIFFMVVMAIAVVYGVAIKFPPPGRQDSKKADPKEPKNIIVYVQSDWIERDHYLMREGHLKINGEEIPLTVSDNRANWDQERENGYATLGAKMGELLEQNFKKDVLIIQGDMKTYHGKVMQVIDKGKGLGIDGFSLVPPTR